LLAGNLEEAGKGIRAGLATTGTPEFLIQHIALKLLQKDYTTVRVLAAQVLKQNPEEVRALRGLAWSYVAQKQPEKATQVIRAHAAENPNSAVVQFFLGEWLLAAGDDIGARSAFSAVKAADHKFKPVDLELARLDFKDGNLAAARNALSGMTSDTGIGVAAHIMLAKVETKAGNFQAAVDHYRAVLETDQQNTLALNNLAYLLANAANETDQALAYAQRARELAPKDPNVGGTLGWIYFRKALYNNALQSLREAVTADGQSSTENAAVRKYHLAMTYSKLGDRQHAFETLQAALKINPKLPEAELASEFLSRVGRY
jgi:tetratricopeptide (TPR) repeat protein